MKDSINHRDSMDQIAADPPGSKCTFEVEVGFRKNSTWQGQIFWVEKNIKRDFRSVLEMLTLTDDALKRSGTTIEEVRWEG